VPTSCRLLDCLSASISSIVHVFAHLSDVPTVSLLGMTRRRPSQQRLSGGRHFRCLGVPRVVILYCFGCREVAGASLTVYSSADDTSLELTYKASFSLDHCFWPSIDFDLCQVLWMIRNKYCIYAFTLRNSDAYTICRDLFFYGCINRSRINDWWYT
jgi:hypothetical protein